MPDVLIRGLSEQAMKHYDAEAKNLGISRAEALRRRLEAGVEMDGPRQRMTDEDWNRFADAFADLADPEVMRLAWQ